jgi:hypothetical protein
MTTEELRTRLRDYFNEHAPGWDIVVASAHNLAGEMLTVEVRLSSSPPATDLGASSGEAL